MIGPCEHCGRTREMWRNQWSDASRSCAQCVIERTHPTNYPAEHGTRAMYNNGCREECCRKPTREAKRKWRAKKKAAMMATTTTEDQT